MNVINQFSLQEHHGNYENWPSKSKLFSLGQYTGIKLPGFSIEKQLAFDDYYLLFTNYDCPFEESYHVIILSKANKIVGQHSFVPPWLGSYRLDSVDQRAINRFVLTFNGNVNFELTVNFPKSSLFSNTLKVTKL